jgi:hypothetical protein
VQTTIELYVYLFTSVYVLLAVHDVWTGRTHQHPKED